MEKLTPPLPYPIEPDTILLTPVPFEPLESGFVPVSSRSSSVEVSSSLPWMTRIRCGIGRIGLAGGLLTGGVVSADALLTTPAAADAAITQQVYGTNGEGLYLHPDSPSLNSPVSDLLPDGANFDVNCWTPSDVVLGDSIWLYGTNESTGNTGYLSDAYINTPVTTDNEGPQLTALGVPECGVAIGNNASADTGSFEGLQPAASLPPFLSFDRNAVASWALTHAEDAPPNDGSCTIFASEALWAGGVPQTTEWNNGLNLIQGGWRNGTNAAWAAENFLEYMQTVPFVKVEPLGPMSSSNNNIPDARLGDIIAYDWTADGSIDHLDVVTGFSGQYPLVSGWSEDGANRLNYNQRGWTYSRVHDTWLQNEPNQKGMVAYLIHVNSDDDLNITNGN